jgi:hypothetical protein
MYTTTTIQMENWPIGRLIPYARNPRKNDKAVDQMCGSLREFGFKIPCLVRSDGEVVDGHLRLKAAHQLGISEVPVILCDEWTPAQVKAFRLLVNRSATWADWDEELLALELQDIERLDFNLDLTGFDVAEIEDLLDLRTDEEEALAPPLPPVATSRSGDLWLLGEHRVLCGDATSPQAVGRLLQERQPFLMVTDPPYGVELDSEWRDRAGLNGCGSAESSYLRRTEGHRNTSISCDTRADWSDAFALVPTLEVAYVWHASTFTREVLDGLLRIGFLHHQQIIWNKGRSVLTRTHYWFQHEPCWYVRKKKRAVVRQTGRELHDLGFAVAEIHHGGIGRGKVRSSDAEAVSVNAAADREPYQARRIGIRAVPGQRHNIDGGRNDRARVLRSGARSKVR